jgi:hypothetical protein
MYPLGHMTSEISSKVMIIFASTTTALRLTQQSLLQVDEFWRRKQCLGMINEPQIDHTTEWISCHDPNTNSPYYYNTITGNSQWEPPFVETNHGEHFSSPPGGLRPNGDDKSPILMKIKSKSGIKIGSFRNSKIVPVNVDPSQNDESTGADQRKISRPTVKLKGTPLMNLKRALSNQVLEIDTGSQDMESSLQQDASLSATLQSSTSLSNPYDNLPPLVNDCSSPLPPINPVSSSIDPVQQTASPLSRDYLHLAQTYQRYIPYMNRFFDSENTRCVLCHLHTPIDLLFPCAHRCICRNCLSLPPYDQLFPITNTPAQDTSSYLNYDISLPSHQQYTTTDYKPKRAPCPVCKAFVKLIIPVNGKGTEETEYWDWVLESKNPVATGGGVVGGVKTRAGEGLNQQFYQQFATNIPKILECVVQDHHQKQQEDGGTRSEKHGSCDKMGEEENSFPQFGVQEQRQMSLCCLIQ